MNDTEVLLFQYAILSNRLIAQRYIKRISFLKLFAERAENTMNEIYDLLDTFDLQISNGSFKLIPPVD